MEKICKINLKGLKIIKKYESLRLNKYKDIKGLATIGFGHLIKKSENFSKISEAKAEELLKQDVKFIENAVNKYVKATLNSNQFSALVSLVFNIGTGAFKSSSLLIKLNQGNFDDVPGEILRWHRANKKPIKGLISRRAEEANLFLS